MAKSEGRPNHHFDVLVGVYAIADVRGLGLLPSRDVVEARLSQARNKPPGITPAAGGGVRTTDGRPFFATQRR
jgi:hypothetical protein